MATAILVNHTVSQFCDSIDWALSTEFNFSIGVFENSLTNINNNSWFTFRLHWSNHTKLLILTKTFTMLYWNFLYLHRFSVKENGRVLLFALWIKRINWAKNCVWNIEMKSSKEMSIISGASSIGLKSNQIKSIKLNELTSLLLSKTIFVCLLIYLYVL